MIKSSRFILGFIFLFSVSYAQSATFGFGCITSNSSDCGSIEGLFTLTVTEDGSDTLFRFDVGAVPNASITQIYFADDGDSLFPALPGVNGIDYEYTGTAPDADGKNGVDFQDIASGGQLPGGGKNFDTDFNAQAVPPAGDDKNGIDNGEFLAILFKSTNASAIIAALTSGLLNIGIHVQSVGTGLNFSESLTTTAIPIPAAAILFGSALLGFAGFATRRRVS